MKKHRFTFTRESASRLTDYGEKDEKLNTRPPALVEEDTALPLTEEAPNEMPDRQGETSQETEKEQSDAHFLFASRTDIGKVRASNQDALILSERLFGVADGMGGHRGGETASATARDCLIALLKDKEPDSTALQTGVEAANRRVYLKSEDDENLRGMGTTMTVLWLGDVDALIAHVGDSRCYLLRDGELKQVTNDHSLVMEMVRAGALTEAQARTHPMRNVITRAVGTDRMVDVDLLRFEREKGDLWLLCSDGLHGMVEDEEMLGILIADDSLEDKAQRLLDAALDAGGRDNVSLVLLLDQEGSHA